MCRTVWYVREKWFGLDTYFFYWKRKCLVSAVGFGYGNQEARVFFYIWLLKPCRSCSMAFFLLTFMTSEAAALTAGRRARKVARGKYVFISKSLFLKLIFISTQFRGNHLWTCIHARKEDKVLLFFLSLHIWSVYSVPKVIYNKSLQQKWVYTPKTCRGLVILAFSVCLECVLHSVAKFHYTVSLTCI